MKNIVFFGDSFACDYSGADQFGVTGYRRSYLDFVAQELDRKIICMGFGGRSWWYSYVKFNAWRNENLEQWDQTDHVVMCLTSPVRLAIVDYDSSKVPLDFDVSVRAWVDENYYRWIYKKLLDEVVEWEQTGKKIIVLPCFDDEEQWLADTYNGKLSVSKDCLFKISDGEFAIAPGHNTKFKETRSNHLNEHNNAALAQDIVYQFRNYQRRAFNLTAKNYAQTPRSRLLTPTELIRPTPESLQKFVR